MENEKLRISISPITIEIEAPSGIFAQRPAHNPFLDIVRGLLSGLTTGGGDFNSSIDATEGNPNPVSGQQEEPVQEKKKAARPSRKTSEANASAQQESAQQESAQQESAQQESAQQESAQQEAPRYTMVDIKLLSGKKDDRNPNPGGTRFMIREQLGKFGCTVLGELKEENFAEMMDFLSTLPDAK